MNTRFTVKLKQNDHTYIRFYSVETANEFESFIKKMGLFNRLNARTQQTFKTSWVPYEATDLVNDFLIWIETGKPTMVYNGKPYIDHGLRAKVVNVG